MSLGCHTAEAKAGLVSAVIAQVCSNWTMGRGKLNAAHLPLRSSPPPALLRLLQRLRLGLVSQDWAFVAKVSEVSSSLALPSHPLTHLPPASGRQ